MGYSYSKARRSVHRQLFRFARQDADLALLVRTDPDTGVTTTHRIRAARLEYRPNERGLYVDGSSRILISAKSLELYGSPAPDYETDNIYFAGGLYRIIAPPLGPRQGDPTILFYDCNVLHVQAATYLKGETYLAPISLGVGADMGDISPYIIQPVSVSFAVGNDMEPIPIAQAQHFLEVSYSLGADLAGVAATTEYLAASFGLGYTLGDVTFIEAEFISVSFDMGIGLTPDPVAGITTFIQVAFGLGADVAAVGSIPEQSLGAVAFGVGNSMAAVVTAAATDTGDATATIDDTTPAAGQTLTCTFNDNDPEGPATGITYQWRDQTLGLDISGATASTYIVQQNMVGKTLRCRVNYTDGAGFAEQIETATTSAVAANNSAVSLSSFPSNNTGTTAGTLATQAFNLAANDAVLVIAACVGSGASVDATLTNNKGLTVYAVHNSTIGWTQTVNKNASLRAWIIYNGTGAQTSMTCTATFSGTKERIYIEAFNVSGTHLAAWRVNASPGGIIRQVKTTTANTAGTQSWSQTTTNSGTTASRWVWCGQAVAVGEAGENDDFTSATLAGVGATALANFSSASPGHQIFCATRIAGTTSSEAMAITASGSNNFRELNGISMEFQGTPP